jgi:hypothetical protein
MIPWLDKIKVRIQRGRLARARQVSFNFNSDGLTYSSWFNAELEYEHLIPWTKIEKIAAFKRDCYTVDLICIAFETSDFVHEINEEMVSWPAFVKEIATYLPGCLKAEEWYEAVMLLAFETNLTVLYSREVASNLRLGA